MLTMSRSIHRDVKLPKASAIIGQHWHLSSQVVKLQGKQADNNSNFGPALSSHLKPVFIKHWFNHIFCQTSNIIIHHPMNLHVQRSQNINKLISQAQSDRLVMAMTSQNLGVRPSLASRQAGRQAGRQVAASGKHMMAMLTTSQLGYMALDNKLKRIESNFRSISQTVALKVCVWTRLHPLSSLTQIPPSFLPSGNFRVQPRLQYTKGQVKVRCHH